MKDKKTKVLVGIGIFVLLLTIIGATYASNKWLFIVLTGTKKECIALLIIFFKFLIHATLENFAEGMESLKGSTTATATLKANNTTNQATGKYNTPFNIV